MTSPSPDACAVEFETVGDKLAPAVPASFKIRNELATSDHSPAPHWVEALLRSRHKCEPYPAKSRHHIGVWELLVRRLPVTSQAKAVAAVLAEHWPTISPSLRRIADLSGLSRSSVLNGIHMLVHAGLLQLETTSGRRTNYLPAYPERAITEDEVRVAFEWRRRRTGGIRPGTQVDGSDTENTDLPVHHVNGYPPTTWTTPAHDVNDTHSPRGREVINGSHEESRQPSPGADDIDDGLMGQLRRERLQQEAARKGTRT